MKPIRGAWRGAVTTLVLLIGLAFAASLIPHTSATEPRAESTQVEKPQVPDKMGLQVEIRDVNHGSGDLLVLVFDDRNAYNNYDYDRAAGFAEVAADSPIVKVPFASLRDGPYAVFVFHDENGDDDLNMKGEYPLEGYGTSGARNWWQEPTFDQAASESSLIRVKMYYPD